MENLVREIYFAHHHKLGANSPPIIHILPSPLPPSLTLELYRYHFCRLCQYRVLLLQPIPIMKQIMRPIMRPIICEICLVKLFVSETFPYTETIDMLSLHTRVLLIALAIHSIRFNSIHKAFL